MRVTLAQDAGMGRAARPLIPSAVLGTWLFLFTEIMMFCGLISGYLILRGQAGAWPPVGQPRLPVYMTGFNTLLLLVSGWTMRQVQPALLDARDRTVRLLAATFLLGCAFLAIQGYEWMRLIGYGVTTSSSVYGALFYTLIGVHALHVLGALAVLSFLTSLVYQGRYDPTRPGGLLAMRLYWSFVVAVWPVLYVLVYLL